MHSHSVDEPVASSWSEGGMSDYIIGYRVVTLYSQNAALFACCQLQEKHYPDPKASWQDNSQLKNPPRRFPGTEYTNMSTCHTQISDSPTVCGPHSDIHSQLYDVGSWICLPCSNSLSKPKCSQQNVPCTCVF